MLWFYSSLSAADIYLKLGSIEGETLYRCENGSVVEDSADCGGQVSMAQYIKIDWIEGESSDKYSMSSSGGAWKIDVQDISLIRKAGDGQMEYVEVEVETAAGPLALGLGAIIAIGADCPRCLFEEEEIDVEDETLAASDAPGLGAIIAIGAVNVESDEDALVDCKVTKVSDSDIECEVVAIHEIKGHLSSLPPVEVTSSAETKAAVFLCHDGVTAVSRMSDCPDDIDIDIDDASTISPPEWYRCEDGTVIEFGESCPPIIMKAQAIKIDWIDGEVSESGSTNDTDLKQGGNNTDYFEDQDRLSRVTKPSDGEDRLTENVSLKIEWEDRVQESMSLKAEKREEVREARKEYISTYKGAFVKRIGNRLDNIPAKNLETALEKINTKIEETQENDRMSDAKKESYMDALYALLEIVEDKIGDIKWEITPNWSYFFCNVSRSGVEK